jgi:Ras family protein A
VESQWAKEVAHFCRGVPIVLVGNKSDLRGEQQQPLNVEGADQQVTFDQICEVAKKIEAHSFLECSAKLKDGVKKVFETAARAAIARKKSYMPKLRLCTLL